MSTNTWTTLVVKYVLSRVVYFLPASSMHVTPANPDGLCSLTSTYFFLFMLALFQVKVEGGIYLNLLDFGEFIGHFITVYNKPFFQDLLSVLQHNWRIVECDVLLMLSSESPSMNIFICTKLQCQVAFGSGEETTWGKQCFSGVCAVHT